MDSSARRKIFVELKLGHGLSLLDFTTKGSGSFVLKIFCSSILVTGRTSRWEGWWPWERSFLGTSCQPHDIHCLTVHCLCVSHNVPLDPQAFGAAAAFCYSAF